MAQGRGRGGRLPRPTPFLTAHLEELWNLSTDAAAPSLTPVQLEMLRPLTSSSPLSNTMTFYSRGGGASPPRDVVEQRHRDRNIVYQGQQPRTEEEMDQREKEILRAIANAPTQDEKEAEFKRLMEEAKAEEALVSEYNSEAATFHQRAATSQRLADKHLRVACTIRQRAAQLFPDNRVIQEKLRTWMRFHTLAQEAKGRPPLGEVPMDVEDELAPVRLHQEQALRRYEVVPSGHPVKIAKTTEPTATIVRPQPQPPGEPQPSTSGGRVRPHVPLVHECSGEGTVRMKKRKDSPSSEQSSSSSDEDENRGAAGGRPQYLSLPDPVPVHVTDRAVAIALARANKLLAEPMRGVDPKKQLALSFEATVHGLQPKEARGKLARQLTIAAQRTTQAKEALSDMLDDCYPTDPTFKFLLPADRGVLARMKEKQALHYGVWLASLTPKATKKHGAGLIAAAIANLMAVELVDVTRYIH